MAELTGIRVTLTTAATENAGTDDHLYIGVVGTGGGREFPLDDPDWDDFEIEEPIRYKLGAPWERVPTFSDPPASRCRDKSTIRRSCPSNWSWSTPSISESKVTTAQKMMTHTG